MWHPFPLIVHEENRVDAVDVSNGYDSVSNKNNIYQYPYNKLYIYAVYTFIRLYICIWQVYILVWMDSIMIYSNLPRISSSRNKNNSSSPIFNLVPPYSGRRTWSPFFNVGACNSPVASRSPGPTETTSPSLAFFVVSEGKNNPPAVWTSFAARRIRIRSPKGANERLSIYMQRAYKQKTRIPWELIHATRKGSLSIHTRSCMDYCKCLSYVPQIGTYFLKIKGKLEWQERSNLLWRGLYGRISIEQDPELLRWTSVCRCVWNKIRRIDLIVLLGVGGGSSVRRR